MHASNLHALTAQHDEQRKVFRAPEADDDWEPAQCRLLSLHLFSHARLLSPPKRTGVEGRILPISTGGWPGAQILHSEHGGPAGTLCQAAHLGSAAPSYGGGYVDRAY